MNVRMADVIVINKLDSATIAGIDEVRASIAALNPNAHVVTAQSELRLDGPSIEGERVVVVEDGPTLTHGGMRFGAGVVAARRFGAAALIDPEPVAVGSIKATLQKYPMLDPLVPAMGYGGEQVAELEATLNAVDADVVLSATPIDMTRLLNLDKPITRVRYDLAPVGGPSLAEVIEPIVKAVRHPVPAR
jgi:predicted GTPase